MDDTEKKLVAQIEQAFADTIYPGDDKLINANHCSECEEIAEKFRGKYWGDLTDVEFLCYYKPALSLFYAEGFRFYLPAFIRAVLTDPIKAGMIDEALEYHLMPPKTEGADAEEWFANFGQTKIEYFLNRVSGFSPDQKKAIEAYLTDHWTSYSPEGQQEQRQVVAFWDTFEG